jgi:hypothetical protein
MRRRIAAALGTSLLFLSCAGADRSMPADPTARGEGPPTIAVTKQPTSSPADPTQPKPIVVEYMLVRRVSDDATADFAEVAEATLEDSRGWQRAGFDLVRKRRARYRIVLAPGPIVDKLCLPYETHSTYSCQNGPVVALNADRWRVATRKWTGTRSAYRKMLINHEVGHLLGQHHPEVQCPDPGRPAPIMAQQSTELNGCLPNPWPLDREIRRAAKLDLPLAPPFD